VFFGNDAGWDDPEVWYEVYQDGRDNHGEFVCIFFGEVFADECRVIMDAFEVSVCDILFKTGVPILFVGVYFLWDSMLKSMC
jgi:hypothetical protein